MKLILPRLFILFVILFLGACNSDKPKAEVQQDTPTTSPTTEASTATTDALYLPSITMEEMQSLWNNTNQIDYIFYDLPISSSIDNSPSAQVHLRHVSDTPVNMTTKGRCTNGLGRAFYKSNGTDLLEAEIFFSEQCAFFIFYKKGKAVYGNLMTQEGVNFFNQMVSAAQNTQ